MRIELPIYYKDTNNQQKIRCVADAWTFQDNAMGEQYITLTISSHRPILFAIGDYCVYRGETYTLNYIPSETQTGKIGDHGDSFTYENIKFESFREELTRCMLLDITPTTGDYVAYQGTNYTGSAVFTLFCGETTTSINGRTITMTSVSVLAGKIQANLDRMFPSLGWEVLVDYENTHTDDFTLSIDNWNVAQALSEVYNTFNLNYVVKGRQIRIGFSADNVTGEEMFAFGFGKGYPTPNNEGLGLFEIKKVSDSSQQIVTRLRALGSTKNMPYRYYNKKYNLPQAMFPLNLQLPDTFETPSVKAQHNALRDSSLRHVLGDTNDAYIDKNDNAADCVEGVRESVARWDGSDSNLKEIYPTIKEGTYSSLRNALVPDQSKRTGNSAYPGYQASERVDEVLAIGYSLDGAWVNDVNIGDGIIPETSAYGKNVESPAVRVSSTTIQNSSLTNRSGLLYGQEVSLWTLTNQSPGAYILVPEHLYFNASYQVSGGNSNSAILAGFVVRIKVGINTLEWFSTRRLISHGETVTIEFPRLPDVENGQSAQIQQILVSSPSSVEVAVAPVFEETATTGSSYTVTYKLDESRNDSYQESHEPYLVWGPDDSTYGTVSQQFHLYIKDIGFNINEYWSGETPKVVMASGVCVSREFEITEVTPVTYTRGGNTLECYRLTLNRASDDTIHAYFPSQYYPISAGDEFVLEGIEMPDVYVELAELRLLRAATDYLADNCDTNFIYKPSINDIYLQWNYDKMVAAGTREKSIYWRLYAGLKFTFRGIPTSEDPLDALPIAEITIESVTIREGEKTTPQVEITLNKNIQQNTIQKLTTTVDRLYSAMANGAGGTGAAVSTSMLLSLLRSEGKKLFLSKVGDDSASGVITFLQGLQAGAEGAWGLIRESFTWTQNLISESFTDGVAWFKTLVTDFLRVATAKINQLTGPYGLLNIVGDVAITADGTNGKTGSLSVSGDIVTDNGTLKAGNAEIKNMLTTKNLTVTGLAHFFELVIDRIKSAGGSLLITPADGFTIEEISNVTGGKKLYWSATDGETKRKNMWQVGDQAICQTFNAATGISYNISNKYYWCLVTAVSSTPEQVTRYTYSEVALTADTFTPRTYYVLSNGSYVLATGNFSSSATYYTRSSEVVDMHYIVIATDEYVTAYPNSAMFAEDPSRFYTRSGSTYTQCSDPSAYDSSTTYYELGCVGDPSKADVGDDIAMLGHRMQSSDSSNITEMKRRQGAIYIAAYNSIDTIKAPLLAFYKGVDDFDLPSHRGTYIDAEGGVFKGQFISTSTNNNGIDIESLLSGGEFNIIYGIGNPNTASPAPHATWTTANDKLAHVGWLYFDLNIEPASEGGRLWRWSQVEAGTGDDTDNDGYCWVRVNDIDSLAALDHIRDVASDGILSGGAEKVRVYLEWMEAKKTRDSLRAQAEEKGMQSSDIPYRYDVVENPTGNPSNKGYYVLLGSKYVLTTDTTVQSGTTYYDGATYKEAYIALGNAFGDLSEYLNGFAQYTFPNVPVWIDPSNVTYGTNVTTELPPFPIGATGDNIQYTGAEFYRKVWNDFYSAVVEMTRALNSWQYKTIEEMGDDGLIDPAEKAVLRQTFNEIVIQYCKDYAESSSLENSISDSTISDNLYYARIGLMNMIDELGTYMNGTEPDGSEGAWNYSQTGYSWFISPSNIDDFEDGLIDPESGLAPERQPINIYPLWLQKFDANGDGVDTQSAVVQNEQWDYFWDRMLRSRTAFQDAIRAAKQYQLENVDVELPTKYYTRFPANTTITTNTPQTLPGSSNPATQFKVGDSWYEEVSLMNPVTEQRTKLDADNNQLYNVYVCKEEYTYGDSSCDTYNERRAKWELVSKPTVANLTNDGSSIVATVFNDSDFSAFVVKVNSIESTVSKMSEGSQNLLINGHFEDDTNHWAAYSGATISVVAQSGLPLTFEHCLKVQTSSGAIRGMQFSTTQQPYILLEEGKTYTFSFWAKADESKRIYVYRGTSNLGLFQIGTDWDRYGYTIEGDGKSLTFSVRDYNSSDAVTFYLVGLQLECGQRTDWQDFGGEPVIMKSQITQLANKISLAVYKNEARAAGIDIEYNETTNSGTTTLYGDKVKIQGDLDLSSMNGLGEVKINGDKLTIENDIDVKGLTTENVTICTRDNIYPIVVNMGVLNNKETGTPIKSIQVKSVNTAGDSSSLANTQAGPCQMVVLPFYDEYVGSSSTSTDNWWNHKTGGVNDMTAEDWIVSDSTSPLFGSFFLYSGSQEDSLRRVVPWKTNGTKLTITNEVDIYARNWKHLDIGNYGSGTGGMVNWLMKRAVLVCADARIVSSANIISTNSKCPFIGAYQKIDANDRERAISGINTVNDAGRFSCGGYMSRFIFILPGQSLQLRSQIVRANNRDVLNWVVENPTEFVPLTEFPMRFLHYQENYDEDALRFAGPSGAGFSPTYAAEVTSDIIMGPSVLNLLTINNVPFGTKMELYGVHS